VADHVHVEDAGLVELVDDGLGGHTDGADEQRGAGLDDDVGELTELALGVVIAREKIVSFLFELFRSISVPFFFSLLPNFHHVDFDRKARLRACDCCLWVAF
jgi:hypothetical protein